MIKLINNTIDIVSVTSNVGYGANDGSYYPLGLFTIATFLKKKLPFLEINIIDLHHIGNYNPTAGITAISASSTLSYKNVLKVAKKAKENNSIVVLGGPHATALPDQILKNRKDYIDFIIKGNGEIPFYQLVNALLNNYSLDTVPNLVWFDNDIIKHNHSMQNIVWNYDSYIPIDFSLSKTPIQYYWNNFREKIDKETEAAFLAFTHFGCSYRESMQKRQSVINGQFSNYCSFCSIDNNYLDRNPQDIVAEVEEYLSSFRLKEGSKILLKCYGDNIGTKHNLLERLNETISDSQIWKKYNIGWTFYSRSPNVSEKLCNLLSKINTWNLFIGFDSADDKIQKYNGLGSTLSQHKKAVNNCINHNIKIQASFVIGAAGENSESLENNLRFADYLYSKNILERINASLFFIIPDSPAYNALCLKEPWIKELDDLSVEKVRWYWIKHFLPYFSNNISKGLEILQNKAIEIDKFSPGIHTSMGYNTIR